MTAILWLRRDLRLHDLPALTAAHEAGGGPVLPVFVVEPALVRSAGAVRIACLRDALAATARAYDDALVVRHGRPDEVLPALVREVGATSIHISAETTPYGRRRDAAVEQRLPTGVPLVATGSPYAVTPGRVLTGSGTPYKMFTPFARAWRDHGWRGPATVPAGVRWHRGAHCEPWTATTSSTGAPDPGRRVPRLPPVGERAALDRWHAFLEDSLDGYQDERDRADLSSTSQMSVHLTYGTIHPRTMLADIAAHGAARSPGATTFVTELAWREFYADVLWHQPTSAWTDLRPDLGSMAYDDPHDSPSFTAWTQGRTGYPFVDAGMRQLHAEGWVHNRLRMVVASFLVKDLHIWWGHGARYFLDHLRDGDVASNNHGWQWVAGTGTDASPYFRVFNPVTQGERFDPDGDYVRRYVPELAHVPGRAVHRPWNVPDGTDHGYPGPVVDHAAERLVALDRYASARDRGPAGGSR